MSVLATTTITAPPTATLATRPAATPTVTTAAAGTAKPLTAGGSTVTRAKPLATPVTPAKALTSATTATAPIKPLTSATTAIKPLATPLPTAGAPAVRHARPAPGATHLSGGAIALLAIAAVLLLASCAWAFARWRAYEPHWLVSLRHAMAEAGFRTSATWAELTDWARLGR